MECSINSPALSLLMKHLVIGQRLISRLFIGHQAVVWFPLVSFRSHEGSTFTESTETSLITESDQSGLNHQLLQLCKAPTAWSDSDQAVRAVHSCNIFYFRLLSY